ncbi:MAG: class I SAM-dependent methyltransferase [Candidatus Methylomirabilia bacterium]
MRPVSACSLCGGTEWATREAAPPFQVVQCGCGLVFVTPQPERGELAAAYDHDYYDAWQGQARQRTRLWSRRLAAVEALAGAPGRLLDVGCGTGELLRLAKTRGWEVTGTEISPYAVKVAETAGLTVAEGEVWEAGFPAGSFDIVTCWHVLEHTRDPKRLLDETHRLLRPGGRLLLATPNLNDRFFRAIYPLIRRRRLHLFDPADREIHLFHFSARTLRALVESVGFTVARVEFDRGAAVVWPKSLLNQVAYLWYRLSGLNWGLGQLVMAEKP